MSDRHDRDEQPDSRRQPSWLERWILPPRDADSKVIREVKSFVRVGVVVAGIFVVAQIGRSLGWW